MRPLPSLVTRQMPPVSATAKVDAADADIGGEEDFAQDFACGVGESGNILGVGNAEFFVEELTDIVAAQMHSGRDDVTGAFAAQLHDVFAEVGFNDADSFCFKCVIEVDLFADHALWIWRSICAGADGHLYL